ncbi:hypothetical protein TNCV_4104251 [Trichonephila clavipes]|nr:hypothetical protein TNCV_4104251 [Trichonephila clavipes]
MSGKEPEPALGQVLHHLKREADEVPQQVLGQTGLGEQQVDDGQHCTQLSQQLRVIQPARERGGNLTENSLTEESIAVDHFDRWHAQNIVPSIACVSMVRHPWDRF